MPIAPFPIPTRRTLPELGSGQGAHHTTLPQEQVSLPAAISGGQVNTICSSCWAGSFSAVPVCLNWHHIPIPSHAHLMRTQRNHIQECLTGTTPQLASHLWMVKKQQEAPAATSVATWVCSLKCIIEIAANRAPGATDAQRGQSPIIPAWSWPRNPHPD